MIDASFLMTRRAGPSELAGGLSKLPLETLLYLCVCPPLVHGSSERTLVLPRTGTHFVTSMDGWFCWKLAQENLAAKGLETTALLATYSERRHYMSRFLRWPKSHKPPIFSTRRLL